MLNQISILGSGLLGASIGMAVKKYNVAKTVKIWARRMETLSVCQKMEWCNTVEANIEKSVTGSELVIICTPVNTIPEIISKISPFLEQDSIVTDVGSTKTEICEKGAESLKLSKGIFIGSHPMAGSEYSGMNYAKDDLLIGKSCIVTPLPGISQEHIEKVSKFWTSLHMTVHQYSPQEHDRAVAYYSHLPHLLASCLCKQLEKHPVNWKEISGNGFKDTTRIAIGDPAIWEPIFQMNRKNLLDAIEDLEKTMCQIKAFINKEDKNEIISFLKSGSEFRKKMKS
jgi:prephenate dehydrogenase